MNALTKKSRKPRMWGRSFQWTDDDEVNLIRDGEDELERHLTSSDPTARDRAAQRLLGPAGREAMRR